ncbi:MAG: hypothetical protein Q8S12_11000 [Hydrogenophaga sp.]|jgi:hypothetical protein|uniref:hypothetical protein n=1 Tax=Hydrogenophaga sp. TaxID=1904254 RepID=UPI00273481C2|nr:hypothetical protein [Hydrogenophaga sp.]MDP3627118.1 hypothetical protein [Hydrogenophaga sp.]
MNTATQWLELVRYAAAGGLVASALTNITLSPSDTGNMLAAAVGAVLTVVLIKAWHILD